MHQSKKTQNSCKVTGHALSQHIEWSVSQSGHLNHATQRMWRQDGSQSLSYHCGVKPNKSTPRSKVFLEKVTVAHVVKKLSTYYQN